MKAARLPAPAPTQRGGPLPVNAPGDALEHDAERAADAVMRGEPARVAAAGGAGAVQRCACGTGSAGGECETCRRKRLQRSAEGAAPGVAPPIVHDVLRGGGHALDADTRATMESRFGFDFGRVRIHTDARAAESARAVAARAYTVGEDVVFGEGQYAPHRAEGQRLLAHELAHVVQQDGGLRRSPMPRDRYGRPLGFVPTPEQEAYDRHSHEIREWEKTLARLARGELDDRDLAHHRLRNRLLGLTEAQVRTLKAQVTSHQVAHPELHTEKLQQFLDVRLAISTPMPDGATVIRDALLNTVEAYTFTVGSVRVRVVKDERGGRFNLTAPVTNFGRRYRWSWGTNRKVTSLVTVSGGMEIPINPTHLEVVIRTNYAVSPDRPSGYGKGTTDDDRREGTTTLRVHEGQHGSDFIDYIRSTPFPVDLSRGVVNVVTVAQMRQISHWISNITAASCELTDQVGHTQDEYLQSAAGQQSGIMSCRAH